jgi:Transposase DDE domain
VLIPPDSAGRTDPRPGWTGGRYPWMRTVPGSHGKLLYRKRIQMIEPVFAHTKHNRTITRFHRRGRTAVRTEWRLLMATHNLSKLHRHHLATAGPKTGLTVLTAPKPGQPVHNGAHSAKSCATASRRSGRRVVHRSEEKSNRSPAWLSSRCYAAGTTFAGRCRVNEPSPERAGRAADKPAAVGEAVTAG